MLVLSGNGHILVIVSNQKYITNQLSGFSYFCCRYSILQIMPLSTGIHFYFFIFIMFKLNIISVLFFYIQSYEMELCNFRFNFKRATKPVHDSGLEHLQLCKAKIIWVAIIPSSLFPKYHVNMAWSYFESTAPDFNDSTLSVRYQDLEAIYTLGRASKYILETHLLLLEGSK